MKTTLKQSVFFLFCLFLFACESQFSLSVVHVNDTHSHFEPHKIKVTHGGKNYYIKAGGAARFAALAKEKKKNGALILHAGDALQGTLYFNRFAGEAEAEFMRFAGFDAMAAGNHEFDRGPGLLANFARTSEVPLLAANIELKKGHQLYGLIRPYVVRKVNGRDVAIIGLAHPSTASISSPGGGIYFRNTQYALEEAVREVTQRGIKIIIALTHTGYKNDLRIARTVRGVDIVIGGHTHTLLGEEMRGPGLSPTAGYPVEVVSGGGRKVCVGQAWKWYQAAGVMEVEFNQHGEVIHCGGKAFLLSQDTVRLTDKEGEKVEANKETASAVMAALAGTGALRVISPDPGALALLKPYKSRVDELGAREVALINRDLLNVRVPGRIHPLTGGVLDNGSLVAPLFAEAILKKISDTGLEADLALVNAGSVRGDLKKGLLTIKDVYAVFPFENTIVVISLSGHLLKEALEHGIDRGMHYGTGGAFPYLAGAKYTFWPEAEKGHRVAEVFLQKKDGTLKELSDYDRIFVAVPSFLANGGDGYTMLSGRANERYDTGFIDTIAFIEYIEKTSPLARWSK